MQNFSKKLLLHIPHSSEEVPLDPKGSYIASLDRIREEVVFLKDWDVIELFNPEGVIGNVTFPYARVFCDVERFRNDENEPMSRKGMGAFYTKCADGTPLRRLDAADHERLLKTYYDAHQKLMAEEIGKRLTMFNECIIVDAHTFPGVRLPFETEANVPRPDICIGTDSFHTPKWLEEFAIRFFKDEGYSVEVNYPFAGAFVPVKYYQQDKRVKSIMVEVNRGYYGDNLSLFTKMQGSVQQFLKSKALI